MMALSAIGLTLGIGGGSYVSRLLGQNKKNEASKVVSTNFFISLIIGILVTVLGIVFIEPILTAFGATETIMNASKEYGIYIILGSSAQITNMTLNNLLRAEGSAKNSMIGMATGAILNIILDPIFIFTIGLGIKGAAIATTLSQFVTLSILIYQYLGHKSLLKIKISQVTLKKSLIGEVLKMGMPTFARQMLMSISMGILNQSAGLYGGESALAAIGIVIKLMMVVNYVIFGLSQGFQPVAGYNFGCGRFDRLKKSLYFTLKASIGFALFSSLVLTLFGENILMIFKPTEDVLKYGIFFLNVSLISLIIMSLTNSIGVYYQAIGKGMPALILSLVRQGIFYIPVLLYLPSVLGLSGVYLSQVFADVLTLILTIIMFMPASKELSEKANTSIREFNVEVA
jgi:putative MATE family efflux protein